MQLSNPKALNVNLYARMLVSAQCHTCDLKVEDVCDVGDGKPLFANFAYEETRFRVPSCEQAGGLTGLQDGALLFGCVRVSCFFACVLTDWDEKAWFHSEHVGTVAGLTYGRRVSVVHPHEVVLRSSGRYCCLRRV